MNIFLLFAIQRESPSSEKKYSEDLDKIMIMMMMKIMIVIAMTACNFFSSNFFFFNKYYKNYAMSHRACFLLLFHINWYILEFLIIACGCCQQIVDEFISSSSSSACLLSTAYLNEGFQAV